MRKSRLFFDICSNMNNDNGTTKEELQADIDALQARIASLQDQIIIATFIHKYGKSKTIRMKVVMELLSNLRISI